MRFRLLLCIVFLFIGLVNHLNGQVKREQDTIVKKQITEYEKKYVETYNQNILKKRINGVYIPADLSEAFKELIELSPPSAIDKFKKAEEAVVVPKLQLGLGRWMLLHWNLYEGSRIGHFIKNYGVTFPEDQVIFLLTTFHRHLNNKDLNVEKLAEQLIEDRKQLILSRQN